MILIIPHCVFNTIFVREQKIFLFLILCSQTNFILKGTFCLHIAKSFSFLTIIAGGFYLQQKNQQIVCWLKLENGNVLPSRHVSMQVLSALRSLTSVFGMRTGGPLQLNHRNGIYTAIAVVIDLI